MVQKPDTPSPAADPDKSERQEQVKKVLDQMAEGLCTIRDILETELASKPPKRLS